MCVLFALYKILFNLYLNNYHERHKFFIQVELAKV